MDEGCLHLLDSVLKGNDLINDRLSRLFDNPLPATTNINSIKRQLLGYMTADLIGCRILDLSKIDCSAEAQRALLEADPSVAGI